MNDPSSPQYEVRLVDCGLDTHAKRILPFVLSVLETIGEGSATQSGQWLQVTAPVESLHNLFQVIDKHKGLTVTYDQIVRYFTTDVKSPSKDIAAVLRELRLCPPGTEVAAHPKPKVEDGSFVYFSGPSSRKADFDTILPDIKEMLKNL